MARYISQHTLACLTKQGAEELNRQLATAAGFAVKRAMFNLVEGKMLVEFESANRETLEAWFAKESFHFDWLLRIELEAQDGRLVAV